MYKRGLNKTWKNLRIKDSANIQQNVETAHVMISRCTLFGCQATLVIVEWCFFLISLLTHLQRNKINSNTWSQSSHIMFWSAPTKLEGLFHSSRRTKRSETYGQAKMEYISRWSMFGTLKVIKSFKTFQLLIGMTIQSNEGLMLRSFHWPFITKKAGIKCLVKNKRSYKREVICIPIIILFIVAYADSLSTTSYNKLIFCIQRM